MKKYILGALIALASIVSLGAVEASAAGPCAPANVRYSSSNNRLYVSGDVSCSLSDLQTVYPKAKTNNLITQTTATSKIWHVRTNIILENGAQLRLHGSLAGGDADEVRLMSNNTSSTSFVTIKADWGSVSINSTNVKSWDDAAKNVDTNFSNGRSYIHVRSRLASDGVTANESRMDIINSDVSYLGYFAAEAYGLVWKVSGVPGPFDKVNVLGDITGSRITKNYFGAYMYGAFGMNIDNNEFANNVSYGLDPHDDSDNLRITNNRSHHNGNHGIICSQRCNDLVITGNQSYNNTGHGIMLHRSTDNSLVEGNTSSYNTDTGIALFESNNNMVRGNTVKYNKTGIRLSVGSSFNRFENNTIHNISSNAIYTYKGSDAPVRGDGVNRSNVWAGNRVYATTSGGFVMKLGSTDNDRFENNDFRGNPGAKYSLTGATNTVYVGNQTDPGVVLP